jgi:signal transduction histidine kinase
MQLSSKYKFLTGILLAFLVLAVVSDLMYRNSSAKVPDMVRFVSELRSAERKANHTLAVYEKLLREKGVDMLAETVHAENDIPVYIFSGNELIFWTDNRIDLDTLNAENCDSVEFLALPNSYVLQKCSKVDSLQLVALIPVKNNFPYENEILRNDFSEHFSTNKQVEIVVGNEKAKNAVFSSEGVYLFTLKAPESPVYSNLWGWTGFLSQLFCVLIFLFLYANAGRFTKSNELKPLQYLLLTLSVMLLIGLSLYFNFPRLLYWDHIFNPLQYASNAFLTSLGHLSFFSLFFVAAAYLFYFQTNTNRLSKNVYAILFRIIFAMAFVALYYIVSSLVFHSSIQISILSFKNFSVVSLWVHFLILLWGIGLALFYQKIRNSEGSDNRLIHWLKYDLPVVLFCGFLYYFISPSHVHGIIISLIVLLLAFNLQIFIPKRKSFQFYVFVWVMVYTLFFVLNSVWFNTQKNTAKYRLLAENILINGNTEYDRMTDVLLEELDEQLRNDTYLYTLASSPDSVNVVSNYLHETYLRGFWNKYDMRLNIAQSRSEIDYQYQLFIERAGTKLSKTHFYRVPASYNDMTYLGIFPNVLPAGDTLFFYMEFYPGRDFKSYSFPNLLINGAPDIQNSMGIRTARYEKSKLVYASDGFEVPATDKWIPEDRSGLFNFTYNGQQYYIYSQNHESIVVISELNPSRLQDYLLYFAYTLLVFYLLVRLAMGIYALVRRRKVFRAGLAAKYQYMFVILLIMSFLGIFYVSVNYIRAKYSDEQIAKLESKKKYIQKALQDMYFWNRDLSAVSTQALNFDLQELSLVYETDIHVYDHRGRLVGSSQPLIFNKNLISPYISPVPFFSRNAGINQTEHIGRLEYLSGYSALYNGDYLQIGYIAVPQFLSQEEMRSEIQEFLSVIIHIYLIIIILAVVLSIVIGRQLSAPLKMIENKLKQMRFGHRNEKIDYQMHDEIGQLVAQYNRTVDELEKSASLLARSERETAWKTMARQIAHEINNPLTPMKLTIQQLQRTHKMKDEHFDDYFEKTSHTLIEQIDNLSRIAGTFSNFARMPEAQFTQVDLAAKLKSVVQLFAHNHEQTEIVYKGPDAGVVVLADPEQLTQVFNNLLKNAIQAIPADRKGRIITQVKTEADKAVFSISDNGTGIPDEVAAQLFTPNFTTKSTGMGLGLSISRNIVEIAGGTISFTTEAGKGTTFEVRFPLYG